MPDQSPRTIRFLSAQVERPAPDRCAALVEVAGNRSVSAGREINDVPRELEQVRQFRPEFALMFDFFEHEGTGIALPGLHRRYPIGWHSFAQWAAGQNWKALQQPAA